MATSSLQLTYDEILDHIGLYLSVNRTDSNWSANTTSDVALILRSGLRKAYYPPPLGPGQPAHQWSFLRPWATLTTNAPFSANTITVVNGVVTKASGTNFPSWAAGGFIDYGAGYKEVSTRDGNDQLTLVDVSSDNDAAALTTYELVQYRFALPSDFASIEGPVYYSPDESDDNIPLVRRSDNFIRNLHQDSITNEIAQEPKFYAIYPEPIATTSAQDWYMILWPTPRDELHLKYRYNVQMDDLDATNDTPPGGAQHSEMILEACLSEAELKYNDAPGPHTEKWLQLLAASILLDRQISEADTYGVVPIKSPDSPRWPTAITDPGPAILDGYALSDFDHR